MLILFLLSYHPAIPLWLEGQGSCFRPRTVLEDLKELLPNVTESWFLGSANKGDDLIHCRYPDYRAAALGGTFSNE